MGGSGGRYIPEATENLHNLIEKAHAQERERLTSQVNDYLRTLLVTFNDRDTDATRHKLNRLHELLADIADVDDLLLGGSVGKHTYVDGLSDIDALVLLKDESLSGTLPKEVLRQFLRQLNTKLTGEEIMNVTAGTLAVTVRYLDGTEIQCLPAIRRGKSIEISSADGTEWKETKPGEFKQQLTRENELLNGALVPAIKLFKAINYGQPTQRQLSGYHVESLALDAAKSYKGDMTPRSLLLHIIGHAAERVKHPISDVTGQSRTVDDYLGPEDSPKRRDVALVLAGIKRRLDAATSLAQWKTVLGE